MSDEETFKVTDRRGRGDASSDPAPPASQEPGSSTVREAARRDEPGPSGEGTASAPASDLGALFMMFASSALINLGIVPDPEKDERRLDLGQAQAAIDVLLMLREKTAGNRSEQESRLLEDLLYDLQMRFVRAARGSSSPNTAR